MFAPIDIRSNPPYNYGMFIQTEETPNPQTMKFIPGVEVMKSGTATFTDKEAVKKSPLAGALFHIDNVEGVFFGADFVTVTKSADAQWESLKPHILTTIMDHFISGMPLIEEDSAIGANISAASTVNDNDDEIVKQIKELIDTRVRPAVAQDGGDIVYQGFENGVVQLELYGACSGCPSSTVTLKNGIENMLRHYVPEVESVEAVNSFGDL